MTQPPSYTKELEKLILETLLPIYEKYHLEKGTVDPLKSISPKLLNQITARKKLAALLR